MPEYEASLDLGVLVDTQQEVCQHIPLNWLAPYENCCLASLAHPATSAIVLCAATKFP